MDSISVFGRRVIAGLLTLTVAVGASVVDYPRTVRISEFLAVNNAGLRDEDGELADWIEIHNPTASAVDLAGWYLTDEADRLTKWVFPSTNLAAGGYLVVFASDKDRAAAGAPLHTNFKLTSTGEYLGLVEPDGVTVASEYAPSYPPQLANVSYGLTPASTESATLVQSNSTARVLVPSGPVEAGWPSISYQPDASWAVLLMPVGYEAAGSVTGASVLFVVATNANATGRAGDFAVIDRLTRVLGYQVTVVHDAAAETSDALGRDLVVVSSTSVSGNVNTKFRDVTVPVINWDRSLVDEFRMGVTPSATTSSDSVVVTPAGAGHPAVAGLAAGVHLIRRSPTAMSVAHTTGLAPGAQVLATANNWPAVILVEPGQPLLDGQAAPARRIHMSWGDAGLTEVNEVGLAVFDAAVRYSLTGSSQPSIEPLLGTDLESWMKGRSSTVLARWTFSPPEGMPLESLVLNMWYDDGFVAYLNGVEVGRHHAPAVLDWSSTATAARGGASVLTPLSLNLRAWGDLVSPEENVLALHGLNFSAADGDFLLAAELIGGGPVAGTPEYYTQPTPGAANVNGSLGPVPELAFSHDRGYYTQAFDLTITNSLPDAIVRYTTNGTPPTPGSGLVYAGPVRIQGTTVVRALAHRPGYVGANVATMSYLFLEEVLRQPVGLAGWPQPVVSVGSGTRPHDYEMDPRVVNAPAYARDVRDAFTAVPTLSLAVNQPDMWDGKGNGGFYRGGAEAAVSVELLFPFAPTNNVQVNGGIEGHSHDRLKRTLRLSFKAEYGPTRFASGLFEAAPLFGASAQRAADSIVLRGGNNRAWSRTWNPGRTTYTEDELYRTTQIAMSGVGPRGHFVQLFINGLYWGLYNPVERPDHAFAAAYLGGDEDDWFAANHGGAQSGDSTRWNYLTGTLLAKDLTDAIHYAELTRYLHVPSFIDYLLNSWYHDLRDWPGNNWWACVRNTPPGPAYFFTWDGEWSFGTRPGEGALTNANVHPVFRPGGSSSSPLAKLWHAARQNTDFMMLVADRAYEHTRPGGALHDAEITARWLTLSNAVRVAVVAESARWGDAIEPSRVRTRDVDWVNEKAYIGRLLQGNGARLIESLRSYGFYPALDPPQFSPPAGLLSPPTPVTLDGGPGGGDLYYTVDGSDPRWAGGGLSAEARLYREPIVLTQSTRLQTRVRRAGEWSALNRSVYAVPGAIHLQVTELMYHPADPTPAESALGYLDDSAFEFIELKNSGANPIALAGLRFTEGIEYEFTHGHLAPNELLLLVRDAGGFAARYGSGLPVWGVYGGALDNDGDTVHLRDAAHQLVFGFRYEDSWQPSTDGLGHSLVPTSLGWPPPGGSASAHWRASQAPGGSPRQDDPAARSGYAAWLGAHFSLIEQANPEISGPDANPDDDRWPNFAEYAFGADPRRWGAELGPQAHLIEDQLKVRFRRPREAADVVYRVEISASLDGDWTDATGEVTLEAVAADGDAELVEVSFQTPVSALTNRFVRVVALRLP